MVCSVSLLSSTTNNGDRDEANEQVTGYPGAMHASHRLLDSAVESYRLFLLSGRGTVRPSSYYVVLRGREVGVFDD